MSEPPKIVASGFSNRFVIHATTTRLVVARPIQKMIPVRPSAMRTRSSEIDERKNAPRRPNA